MTMTNEAIKNIKTARTLADGTELKFYGTTRGAHGQSNALRVGLTAGGELIFNDTARHICGVIDAPGAVAMLQEDLAEWADGMSFRELDEIVIETAQLCYLKMSDMYGISATAELL